MRRPVAVDIGTNSGDAGTGLSVLAPETCAGLTVTEAISVDDGDNVEVKRVQEGLRGTTTVTRDQLVDDVFRNHGGNPFSCVYRGMVINGGLGARATASPEVNTGNGPLFEGLTNGNYFRVVGERSLNIGQPGKMIGVRVVSIKPRIVGKGIGHRS